MLKMLQNEEPWYANGLHFECTGCGGCCTGSPGYVWVNDEEIKAIADHLKISLGDFSRRYLRLVKGNFSLLEHQKTYDCIFLKDKRCQIYPVRPTQCRTFPWWPRNLESRETWIEVARHCEGIHHNAPLVDRKIIEEQQSIQQTEIDNML